MQYRTLPYGGEQISVIGLGNSSMGESGAKETEATVAMALENGVNYFDMAAADATPFAAFGRAVGSERGKVLYQVHFRRDLHVRGAACTAGRSRSTRSRRSVDWQLRELRTDYIDFGFIHCIDEDADLDAARSEGTIDYLLELKKQGVVRHIGMSTHTPEAAHRALDLGILDMLMFSINPAYDYVRGEYGIGTVAGRMELYRRCEAEGVGISVMKPFAAGQLLDARTSPFKRALTSAQCLQYALDNRYTYSRRAQQGGPEGRAVLPQCRRCRARLLRDRHLRARGGRGRVRVLQPLSALPGRARRGPHKQVLRPRQGGDTLARDHYAHLGKKAGQCLHCGHCDSRCPFHTRQSERMAEIEAYFGE